MITEPTYSVIGWVPCFVLFFLCVCVGGGEYQDQHIRPLNIGWLHLMPEVQLKDFFLETLVN